jgi:hypothetical protein
MNIIHLNYPLDYESIRISAECARKTAISYTDSRYSDLKMNGWTISRYSDSYIDSIMTDFGVQGKPRFYFQDAFLKIPEHVDNETLCSINFIISDNPAPITINGEDHCYKQCLLNTTVPHGVQNGSESRILFKISIFNESFETVANKIPFKLNLNL